MTYMGILQYLQEQDLHRDIMYYYGVSMGAFFSFLFALNVPYSILLQQLKDIYCNPDIFKTDLPSFMDYQQHHGFLSGDLLVEALKRIYLRHYNERFPKKSYPIDELTFLDFTKQTGRILTVVATNITLERPEFFSVEITPHICIWDAIQASMTIPLVFRPIQIGTHWYVDGVLTCEFPVIPTEIPKLPLERTLGVFMEFRTIPDAEALGTGTGEDVGAETAFPLPSIMEYTFNILQLQMFYNKHLYSQASNLTYKVWIDHSPIALLPIRLCETQLIIDLTPEEMDEALHHGYKKITQVMSSFPDTSIQKTPTAHTLPTEEETKCL